jgi:cytochrome c heme-lyase
MVPSSSSASTPVVSLSKDQSSIPAHQPDFSEKWVYPSEQQFYNAMKRKGWDLPPGIEKSIPHVVRIHNAVNEKGWKEILEWERIRDPKNDNPRLVRFLGRPKDLSPRARFYSSLWLRNEPFDRHDWFVDRGDGTGQRRYVIDFYNGKENSGNNGLPSMYLDVRPALDDFEAVQDRVKMFFRNAFPGIVELVMNSSSSSSSSSSTTDSYGSKKERQDAGVMVDHHASPKGK